MTKLPSSQDSIVGVFGCHGSSNLRGQVVQFNSSDTSIKTADDLKSDGWGIDVVHIESIAKFLDSRRDLVKVHRLLTAIPFLDEHTIFAFLNHPAI